MEISTQTLVLVGNSDSVSDVNREIVKETLKYMFKNSPDSKAYCLAAYGHEPESEEVYSDDYTELCIQAEELKYEQKETSLIDTLTQIISKWEEADFACRDIVVFTNGLDAESLYYDREELFYTIENAGYPIYIVDLVQEDNIRAGKYLSAISKTSGGRLFLTEYDGSDAQIEQILGDGLFAAMEEYADSGWNVYETQTDYTDAEYENTESTEDEEYENDNYEEESYQSDEEEYNREDIESQESGLQGGLEEYEEGIVYEDASKEQVSPTSFLIIGIAGIILTICLIFVFGCVIFKKKKENHKKDAKYKEIVEREAERKISRIPAPDTYGKTVYLGENIDKHDDYRTRLLFEEPGSRHEIIFEDVNDPSKYYTAAIEERITVGRVAAMADVCIDYDDSVSARHFEIRREEDRYYVMDLGSSNGTYLNGKPVGEPTLLYSGDMISVGMITLIVRF